MAAPLRGTQSLVGQMGWVFQRPSLTLLEVGWRWLFGIPMLLVCWMEFQQVFAALPPESAGLATLDAQNPWVAAVQLGSVWALYQPHILAVLHRLLPAAAVLWVAVSGLGRNLVLKRMAPSLRFRPVAMIALQAAWLFFFAAVCWGWLRTMQWAAATHIVRAAEPDLVGFSMWTIFLSLGFFTAWALSSWAFSIAPLVMLLEDCNPAQALARSLRLGKPMTARLGETNLVMGIVNLALMVLAMVLSAAPLPFSDQLGAGALHWISAASVIFYLVANDYFQVVRLKGFVEFWKLFRGSEPVSQ